jgi:phosphomannomutase
MYAKNYSIDDSIYALMKLLEILKSEKKPLSKLCEEFKNFYKSDEINLNVENPDKVFERIKSTFSNQKIELIDGISVYSKEYWFNIRKSNTEPLVRLNVEANSKKILNLKIEELKEIISS